MTCGTSLKVLLELMTSSANVKMQQQIVSLDVVQLHKTGYVMVFPCCFSCIYICTHIHIQIIHVYTCLYMFIYLCISLYIYIYIYIYMHVYIHIYTYIYICFYVYIDIYIYAQRLGFAQALQRRGSPFPIKCCCNSAFHWEDQQRY